ncbi:MAG: hypothetical protein KY445_08675, partial [Armatimonadetes bacterium]|nr:hypothetical protein [Armatimonadota bacterium]
MQNPPPIASPDGSVSPASQPHGEIDPCALARAQKWVLWALLLSIAGLLLGMNNQNLPTANPTGPQPIPFSDFTWNAIFIDLIRFGIALLMAFAVYRLGRALHIKWAWLAAILSLLPILGIVVLLGLNGQATAKLRAAG